MKKNVQLNIKFVAYVLYKQHWMKRVSPERQLATVQEYLDSVAPEDRGDYTLADYIYEQGYNGELYVCYEEFLDVEYKDINFMREILRDEDVWQAYLDDISDDPDTLAEYAKMTFEKIPKKDWPEDLRQWKPYLFATIKPVLDEAQHPLEYYERLLAKYRSELGDLFYHLWDNDYDIPKIEFLGEGAKIFFNEIVYDYILVHYNELIQESNLGLSFTGTEKQEEQHEDCNVNDSDLDKRLAFCRERSL